MIRSLVSRMVRPVRQVTYRLTGVFELRDRLDRQQATLEALQEMLGQQVACQQQLLRVMLAHDERGAPSRDDRPDASSGETVALRQMLERLIAQQSQSRSALAASIKASEAAVLENLVDEIDRLDGYLVFHTNELRVAVRRLEMTLDVDQRRRVAETLHAKAG